MDQDSSMVGSLGKLIQLGSSLEEESRENIASPSGPSLRQKGKKVMIDATMDISSNKSNVVMKVCPLSSLEGTPTASQEVSSLTDFVSDFGHHRRILAAQTYVGGFIAVRRDSTEEARTWPQVVQNQRKF